MKTNNGIFSINDTDPNNPKVIFKPVHGTVWLTQPELVELFGVYRQTINAHITAIYKSGAFGEEQTSRYNLYVSRNRIKYDKTHFNLQIVLALAFRINSWQAKLDMQLFLGQNKVNSNYATFLYLNLCSSLNSLIVK